MACVNMARREVANSSSISSITAVQSVSVILLSCDLLGPGPQHPAQSSLHSFLFSSRKAFCGPISLSLACVVLSCFSCVRLFATLCTAAHQAPLSRDSPGKNTGVGCHGLLQGIFSTWGSNPHLFKSPELAGGLFCTVPPGKPFILLWSVPILCPQ